MSGRLARWAGRFKPGINLWLLLGLCFGACTALVIVDSVLLFRGIHRHLSGVCAAAHKAYEEGGAESLRLVLAGEQADPGIRMHLLDGRGRDLATAAPAPGSKPELILATGTYSCVADVPASGVPIPLGPMLWVLPFVSILCGTVGAYITWRMRGIEAAVRKFGAGELAARAAPRRGDSIGRLGQAFNRMAERIEGLVVSHQRLCADLAHELRSPLARLLLAVPAARRGETDALDRIERETGRVNEIVDELLAVARAEADPTALQREPVDLEALLTEIADRCSIEARDRGCEIQLMLARPGTAMGDAGLLRRAIENVLRNAVQHTPESTRIQLCGGGDETCAAIAVRDWGPGVPEAALQDIFRPFYRAHAAPDRATRGMGLGLAIAQRAIAVHGGSIRAENCAPGLRVTIRLPRPA